MKDFPPRPPVPKNLVGNPRAPRHLFDRCGQPITDEDGRPLRRFGFAHAWLDHVLRPAVSSDADLLVTQNGLSLLIEFKTESEVEKLDANRAANAKGYGLGGQRNAQSLLAQTGLFLVYMVEYRFPGDGEKPPEITRYVRLTDGAGAWQWKPCNYEILCQKIWEWRCNVMDDGFVRRQSEAAAMGQLLQIRHPTFNRTSQKHFEALRLTQREWRNPGSELHRRGYESFVERYEDWLLHEGEERSTV